MNDMAVDPLTPPEIQVEQSGPLRTSEQLNELAEALAKAQGDMGAATKNSANPHFKSKFADLAAIVDVSREALSENGLSLVQFPYWDGSEAGVVTRILHKSGQWMEGSLGVKPGKLDAQGIGGVITYMRRYAQAAVLNIPQQDDDGETAVGRGKKITKAQVAELQGVIKTLGQDEKVIVDWIAAGAQSGLKSLTGLYEGNFDAVMAKLKERLPKETADEQPSEPATA